MEQEFPPSGNLVDAEGFVSPTSPTSPTAEEPRWPRKVADASVAPPHLRNTPASSSGLNQLQRRWGESTDRDISEKGKGKGKGPPYAEDNTPLAPMIRYDAPTIMLDIKPKQDKRAHDGTSYVGANPNEIWSSQELYAASHKLTTYLRHGDRHHIYHTDDGYVDVNIIV